jgi:sugar O-acyltransferase (sialic acid O-acetyltransferase NeuD family)
VSGLVIFGTGDIARLAHLYFTTDSPYRVAGFCIDRAYRQADTFDGRPIVDFEEVEAHFPPASHHLFVAVGYKGMNRLRREKCAEAARRGYTLASYVSSRATVLTTDPIGDHAFILEDCTVQPFVTIGRNVTLWSGAHIAHNSAIGDHCFISSHAMVAGHCTVGEACFIGVNATLRDGITVAPRTLIGGGAVVMENTREGGIYVAPRATLSARSSDEIDL